MTSLAFDTLAFSDKLKESGMPPAQAEAQARAMAAAFDASRQDLATKADIDGRFAKVESDLRELELRMTIKLGSMMVVAVAVVAALVKLL